MDTAILKDMINGLEASLIDLNEKRDIFIKAKGLNEETEKLRAEVSKVHFELENEKDKLKGMNEEKNQAMATVTSSMARRMNDVLPSGSAIVEIKDDGSLFIGWFTKTAKVPYSGLSGGEQAAFDPALCKALGGSILAVEAAEIDGPHLTDALRKYEAANIQVIVSSCHAPEEVPENWNTVLL